MVITQAQFAAWLDRWQGWRSGLTGLTGGSGKLDGLLTVGEAAGWIVPVTVSEVTTYYRLTAGTTAESSPWVIRPNDYAAGTNEKVWKLLELFTGSVATYNGNQGKFHAAGVAGSVGAEHLVIGGGQA
jgi:hypothetical protein